MRMRISMTLAAAVLLAACQLVPSTPATIRHTGPFIRPTAAANITTLKPGATASPARPTATPTPFHVFDPSLPSSALAGTLRMDASYFVSSGVIAAGGANVIAAGGANVIAAGGGNVIAAGGANVIAAGGANVIAAGGANVIAAGGANVIAAGGANVIAAGGANVIAAGGANYRLLDIGAGTSASASGTSTIVDPATIAFGTVLPAAGMLVVPVSLVTNTQIGDAVLSDSQGHFQVTIPKSEIGTVRLFAAVPGKTGKEPWLSDARMQYSLLTAADRTVEQNAIDEDSSVVSKYLITSFQARFKQALAQGLPAMINAYSNDSSAQSFQAQIALLEAAAAPMSAAFDAVRAKNLTLGQLQTIAQRCTGLILNDPDMPLSAILGSTFDTALGPSKIPTDQPGQPPTAGHVLAVEMREFREAAANILAVNPDYFDTKPYIKGATPPVPTTNGRPFQKATDLSDFVVSHYLSVNDPATFRSISVLTNDLQQNPQAHFTDTQPVIELNGAGAAMAKTFFLKLITDQHIQQALIKELQSDAQNPPS